MTSLDQAIERAGFDAGKIYPGLTESQRERTNAHFDKLICKNIDWIAYQAHRTRDQGYVNSHIANYALFALNSAHNGE